MARILAVDDDQQNLMLIELYLKGQEFDVVRASDGREALERADGESFDLILLDVLMPQMDGFEVCRRLKADPKTAFTPVIFLTARMSDESEKLQAYEMGAVDYIQKPVHKEELVARIRVMLRLEAARNRLERENAALAKELRSAQASLRDCQRDLSDLDDLERNRAVGGPGVVVLDGEGRIRSHNAQAELYLGALPVGEALAEASEHAQSVLDALHRGGNPAVVQHPMDRGSNGRRLVVRQDGSPGSGLQCLTLVDETASHSIRERLASRRPVVFPEDQEDPDRYRVTGIIGRSPTMNEMHQSVDRLRQTRSTVLIYGESGCGKELVARALHFDGRWRSKPFIPIHCGAMSPELIESELFGYEKGAFTGAQNRKDGLFSAADGGTIFLDEVAETSTALQVKLLRVLQTGEIRPVGSNRPQLVDVRIIAATNRNLESMVEEGTFREDLFFRLDKVTLNLPPLRERLGDLELLIQHFLQKYNSHYDGQAGPIHAVSEGAMGCMRAYPWSGNVRELENVVDRAFAMGVTEVLQEADLPRHVREGRPRFATGGLRLGERPLVLPSRPPVRPLSGDGVVQEGGLLDQQQEELERQAILQALRATGGRKVAAAGQLGWSKSKIYRKMKELGMEE